MYLAVDIGATKTLLAVFTADGAIKETLKFATPEDYPDLITALSEQVALLKTQVFSSAAIAVPGRLDRVKGLGVAFGNRPWQNVPILKDAKAILQCPVIIENDTKLAALSEALLIKKEFSNVLYVTISTGISAGLIIDGIIDINFADSESGQMMLEHKGRLATWQSFASGKAIVAEYGKRASEITDPAAWKTIAHNIAIGLIDLIAVVQPHIIIIGGGVGTHFAKFESPLLGELKQYETPLVPIPPIRKAQRPEEAVIYGCYNLITQSHAPTRN